MLGGFPPVEPRELEWIQRRILSEKSDQRDGILFAGLLLTVALGAMVWGALDAMRALSSPLGGGIAAAAALLWAGLVAMLRGAWKASRRPARILGSFRRAGPVELERIGSGKRATYRWRVAGLDVLFPSSWETDARTAAELLLVEAELPGLDPPRRGFLVQIDERRRLGPELPEGLEESRGGWRLSLHVLLAVVALSSLLLVARAPFQARPTWIPEAWLDRPPLVLDATASPGLDPAPGRRVEIRDLVPVAILPEASGAIRVRHLSLGSASALEPSLRLAQDLRSRVLLVSRLRATGVFEASESSLPGDFEQACLAGRISSVYLADTALLDTLDGLAGNLVWDAWREERGRIDAQGRSMACHPMISGMYTGVRSFGSDHGSAFLQAESLARSKLRDRALQEILQGAYVVDLIRSGNDSVPELFQVATEDVDDVADWMREGAARARTVSGLFVERNYPEWTLLDAPRDPRLTWIALARMLLAVVLPVSAIAHFLRWRRRTSADQDRLRRASLTWFATRKE